MTVDIPILANVATFEILQDGPFGVVDVVILNSKPLIAEDIGRIFILEDLNIKQRTTGQSRDVQDNPSIFCPMMLVLVLILAAVF